MAGYIPEKDIKIEIVGLRPGEKLFKELLNTFLKTLPMHHKKIMIAQEESDNFRDVLNEVDYLIAIASTFSKNDIVQKMKDIVTEFVSINSYFEMLDN